MAAVATQSAVIPSQETENKLPAREDGALYWWQTSGQDLSRMLQEAGYPDEARRQFLEFFRDTLCPALGAKPYDRSLRTAVGWDGSPFEYSFEFKQSTKNAGVVSISLSFIPRFDKTPAPIYHLINHAPHETSSALLHLLL